MSPRTRHLSEHPTADRPWSVETAGIESVADDDRHGTASELFWVWLGANIGIVGMIYGAVLTTLGLNLWQGAAAAVVGTVLSFVVVGVLGGRGQVGGAPMLGLSRIPFGRKGNLAPAFVSWISLLGWETLTAVIAAYAVLALLATATVHRAAGRRSLCPEQPRLPARLHGQRQPVRNPRPGPAPPTRGRAACRCDQSG
jgi:cytosine/uracil/thiamine/allantoin permease